jgi:hypothetical protein
VLITVLIVVVVTIMSALVVTTDAVSRVQASWTSLRRVLSSVNNKTGTELTLNDFDRLNAGIRSMANSLKFARNRTRFLRPFRSMYADLDTMLQTVDAAHELTLAASDMLNGLEPALFFLTSGEDTDTVVTQVSSGERIVELLELGRGRFLSAQSHLTRAQSFIESLNLEGASSTQVLNVKNLIEYLDQLQQVNSLLLDAPELLTDALGLEGTRNYLILSQNSDELRPSGGFISTYGWMSVRNARIIDYDYSASTAISPNPPPDSLASQIDIPDWWIPLAQPIYAAWDSSWYADFPATAEMAAWFYDSGGNPQSPVDGVIAIDIVAFEYLLDALGNVLVPGYEDPVTSENFREQVYAIRASGEADEAHKQFVAALYGQILSDWQSVDQEKGTELLGATLRAVQEKHIMLYFSDDRTNEAINLLGWSGAQQPAVDHDYLMVADANLGSKSNHSISRQLTYDVAIEADGSLQSRLTVAYDFSARAAEEDPAVNPAHYSSIDYHNLMQVFVPAGSLLTDTDNFETDLQIVQDDTHTIFTALTEVEYNSSERFQFLYTVPSRVETFGPYQRYRLRLQKQSGMRSEVASVQVALPPGASTISTSPQPMASYSLDQPILEFRVDLMTDRWIDVIYSLPE